MKPASAELINLLAGYQFFAANLYTITLADGTLLRLTDGDGDIGGMTPAIPAIHFNVHPTTIIAHGDWYYVGLQENPDTGFSMGGFYAVNKKNLAAVDYTVLGHATNALVYANNTIYYTSGSTGYTNSSGLYKVPLNGDPIEFIEKNIVGLTCSGSNLWTVFFGSYQITGQFGQWIYKLDMEMNIVSMQQVNTLASGESRYPEGYNVYFDNNFVWAVLQGNGGGVFKIPLSNDSFQRIAVACTHLAFTPTYVFASGSNQVVKINKSTLAVVGTFALSGARHILYIPALNKLAVSTGNTVTYMLLDGTIDSVVDVHAGARQSIWSGGKLLTTSYGDHVVTGFYSDAIPAQAVGFLADPIRIERGDIATSTGIEVDECTVTMRAGSINGLSIPNFALVGGFDNAHVLIEAAIMPTYGDTSAGVLHLFEGKVTDVDIDGFRVDLTVSGDSIRLDTQIPKLVYQPSCAHTLYDDGCKLAADIFTEYAAVEAGSTAADIYFLSEQAQAFFSLGKITFVSGANTGLSRTVRAHDAGTPSHLALALAFPFVPVAGDVFMVAAGCDKSRATCAAKFGNASQFLGWEYMPVPEASL